MKRIVGIIGGAGVAATNKLNELIETKITENGAFRDSHHPEIIIYQAVNVPSRSMFLEGKGESFIPGYIDIGNKLKASGADVLCMCCNTAHHAIDEIQEEVNLPFINIIEEVVKKCRAGNYHNIGLIASDGCLSGRVYEKYFEKIYPDANLIYPDAEMQKNVTRGICNIKNKNRFLPNNHEERPSTIFQNVYEHLRSRGTEVVIIGCTDIRVDFSAENTIDSLEVMADAIMKSNSL